MNEVIMTSLSMDELKKAIREVLKQELIDIKEKDLMTAKEVIDFLSISKSCLNEWKSNGVIPYKRLGKRIYFRRSEITEALKEAGNYKNLKRLE